MTEILIVGAGGFIGAALRYLMALAKLFEGSSLPVSTMLVNLAGAFAIGAVSALAGHFDGLDSRVVLFLTTGLCGGFTTFSTFSLETLDLISSGNLLLGAVYAAASTAGCVLAVFAGRCAMSLLVR
jgi:CrcB protein